MIRTTVARYIEEKVCSSRVEYYDGGVVDPRRGISFERKKKKQL